MSSVLKINKYRCEELLCDDMMCGLVVVASSLASSYYVLLQNVLLLTTYPTMFQTFFNFQQKENCYAAAELRKWKRMVNRFPY